MGKGKVFFFSLLGLSAAAGYYFLNAVDRLQFGAMKLNGKDWAWSKVTLKLNLPIINPTSSELPFSSFRGTLEYNGRRLGDVIVEKWLQNGQVWELTDIPIKANSTVNLPVNVVVNYLMAAGNIQDMIDTKEFLGSLLVKGTLKSGSLSFPIETKIF